MEDKKLTLYKKDKIIKLAMNMSKYCGNSEYENEVIKASHLLMNKVRYCDTEDIILESDFIEEILFILNEDGTKSIVRDVFYYLRSISADFIGVSFDKVHISGFDFNGLKNVEIHIQQIPNLDISKTYLKGVKLTGTLDGANIKETDFTGYVGDLVLNPQLVKNKNLYRTHIDGLTVKGSFDDVNIKCMFTKGFKGEIIINPQRVLNKQLWHIDFNGIHLVGDYNEINGTYGDPCFDDCRLCGTSFKGCIGNVVIALDKIYLDAILCNFTGVKLTGKTKNNDSIALMCSYYEDENEGKIYLTNNMVNGKESDKGEEKMNTHKTKTRKISLFNRILDNY